GDVDKLLDSYDVERHEAITKGVEVLTDRLSRFGLFTSQNTRSVLLGIIGKLIRFPIFQRRALMTMTMLGTRYRHSPLFFGRSSLIGYRSPEVGALAEYRPSLFLYQPSEDVSAAANALDIPDLQVAETNNWAAWKCSQPFAALVRPDGIVGYFQRDPTPDDLRQNVRAALGFSKPVSR
ncbi:MAG: hypothetical protein JO233_07000, partial [Candidatus Eremiobacteraeota bacterium]|nr:hypothetical protein [Candidatus Eremiobacteraeota bacterium]